MNPTATGKSFVAHLREDLRYSVAAGLGFASGMPFLLLYSTQSAWLSDAGQSVEIIGMMIWLTIAYKLKFLWAPFLDQFDAPVLSRHLGRRRGWIVLSQIGVILALIALALGDPANRLWLTIAFSLALGVAGATQDIVIDSWRIAAAPPGKLALMTSFAEAGYRVGNLAAGAGALYFADKIGWPGAYLVMAALMAPGAIAAFLAPEPEIDVIEAAHPERPGLIEAIVAPIREFMTRLGPLAWPVLLLVAGFRMPGYISSDMAMPLFKHLHYSNADIALVTKIFGFVLALGATFLCGFMAQSLGLMTTMLIGTVAASASHLALAYLAAYGGDGDFWRFAIAVSLDSFAYSFASMVLITFMSALASAEYAGSQFALLTSLCAMPGFFLAGLSGFLVARVGYIHFFVATSIIGLPVAFLCWRLWRRHGDRLNRIELSGQAPAHG